MRPLSAIAACIGVASSLQAQANRTYDLLVAGMSCKQLPGSLDRQIQCDYRVGHGLAFSIIGVGATDAAIVVAKSEGYESDYYFSFGLLHGCVTVWPGKEITNSAPARVLDVAFVSPKSGKVYLTWQECRKAS